MSKYTEQARQQETKGALEATNGTYKSALHDTLIKVLDIDQIIPLVEWINKSMKEKMETQYAVTDRAQMIVHPTDQKRILTKCACQIWESTPTEGGILLSVIMG